MGNGSRVKTNQCTKIVQRHDQRIHILGVYIIHKNIKLHTFKLFTLNLPLELRFVEIGDCKYHINFQNKSALSTANITCRSLGGSLAMIKTEAIQRFLENSTAQLYGTLSNISFWIGGYKRNGQWMWDDLTSIENGTGFTKWSENSPNSRGGGLIMSSQRNASAWMNLHWFDENESSEEGFVCEIASKINYINNMSIYRELGEWFPNCLIRRHCVTSY